MTKTLTEQWREGTLPKGWYYLLDCDGKEWFRYLTGRKPDADFVKCFKEVLAPVPSYDEWQAELASNDELLNVQKRLEKKLEIAIRALKKIIRDYEINGIGYLCVTRAKQALKETEGVK